MAIGSVTCDVPGLGPSQRSGGGRPAAETWRASNVVRSVARARRVRALARPSHTRDVAADRAPGRSGRRGLGPADPLPRLDPGRGRLVALPGASIARGLGRPVPDASD